MQSKGDPWLGGMRRSSHGGWQRWWLGNEGEGGLEAAAAVEVTGACGSRGTDGCSISIAPQKQQRRQITWPKLQPGEGSDGGAARATSPTVEAAMGGPLERDAEEARSPASGGGGSSGSGAVATTVVVP
ncbi:hypothetical protein C4D60_Mb07t12080 [Musa balbisiana]|uniref:Uncharacterized protein n=1 Tax=Musa balbisiana TaxID=52838 RepID=A0A4S8JEY6_MUSBA|nr:hypothetical protein C4D60_Mb07t12080 [Musa balbisiana]